MNVFAAVSAGMALFLALAGAAEAATIRVVALTGQEAPGTGGERFTGFQDPALNEAGDTSFTYFITGSGANFTGILTSGVPVAQSGDAAPGAGGAPFLFLLNPALNDAGETAFVNIFFGGRSSNTGIFASGVLIAREGEVAPGAGGAVFDGLDTSITFNNAGETAFLGGLSGAGVTSANNSGIFTSEALVARAGNAAPGTDEPVFLGFGRPSLNDAGETAFRGFLTGGDVTSENNQGIFTSGAMVARAGDAAPGTGGAVFSLFNDPALNNIGVTAFFGEFIGAGVTTANDSGLFSADALIVREGDVAPGAGGAVFGNLSAGAVHSPLALNDAGDVAFLAEITGTGVTVENDRGIFATEGGVLDLILREGDLLDIGGGDLRTITSLSFTPRSFNNSGDIAFRASFSGGAIGPAGQGIFVYEAGSVSAAVPLPPALGLMLFGVAALGFVGRRRARG